VEKASYALGCESIDLSDDERARGLAERVANAFLWGIAFELPPELKDRLNDALPGEFRSRMNLYSAISDDAKVA
jgi:hypothetical protein